MDKKLFIIIGILLITPILLEFKLVNGDVVENPENLKEDDHEEIIIPDDDSPIENKIQTEDDPADSDKDDESSKVGDDEVIDMEQYIQKHKKNKAKQTKNGQAKKKSKASANNKRNPKRKN